MAGTQFRSVDEYIDSFPAVVGGILRALRDVVREEAPEAEETIKYAMPAFRLSDRDLIYFAAFKRHIGFYPPYPETAPFKAELARFEGPKGAVRFPLDEPMPFSLIREMVRFRIAEMERMPPVSRGKKS